MFLATGSCDKTVNLWNPENGELLGTLNGHKGNVKTISFSPDGTRLATGDSQRTIKIWNMETMNEIATIDADDEIFSVEISSSGATIVVGMRYSVKLWDTTTLQCIQAITGLTNVFVVHFADLAGQQILVGRGTRVEMWTCGGHLQATYDHSSQYHRKYVPFSVNLKRGIIAAGSWDISIGDCTSDWIVLWEITTGVKLRILSESESCVYDVCFSNDGTKLATSSPRSHLVRVWDCVSGVPICEFITRNRIGKLSMSSNDSPVAGCDYDEESDVGYRTYTASGGRTVEPLVLRAHSQWLHAVAYSPEMTILL
jgi:WD40 repeat protein